MRIKRKDILEANGSQLTSPATVCHGTLRSALTLICGLLAMAGLTGCLDSPADDLLSGTFDSKSHITITFDMPNNGTATRSATDGNDGYEAGNDYENSVNIDGGDYRIYFFTYSQGDANGGKLITEFEPTEITNLSTSSTTTYTMAGDVPEELMNVSEFRVVMLANWGTYPTTQADITTTDDLCEGEYATYKASDKFAIDENHLIPFYGVQEYTGITFTEGTTTSLATPVSLLRAIAKVEIILTADSDVDAFDAVSIVNYNDQGYNAPWQVYTAEDYDTGMKNNPSTGNWDKEWIDGLHLVGDANDTETKTHAFTRISDASQDTWRIYVPEYNNMGDDYSYISVTIDGEPYEIYFAEYDSDGTTSAYGSGTTSTEGRLNLMRNNLYRYYVTLKNRELRISVKKWDYVFDNEWKFGNTEPQKVGYQFHANGIYYEVLTSPAGYEDEGTEPDENASLTIKTVRGTGDAYEGVVYIPSTILYYGYTYTVTEIGEGSFDGHNEITTISIPATVTKIGTDAFEGCTSLTSLYIHATNPPECGEDLFAKDNVENITLYVPYGVVTVYQLDTTWGNFGFKAIEAIP